MPFIPRGIRQLSKRLHFSFGVLDASQALQCLSPQIVNAGTAGIELECRVSLSQRVGEFVFALIHARKLEMRAGKLRIEPQRLAKHLFGRSISLLKVIDRKSVV